MLQVPGRWPPGSFEKKKPETHPQACWFCHKTCAKRAWRMHKLYCTDDPALNRHVPIELAFERILARLPKTESVPDEAVCYICLDGGDVLRGCACRGPSAGFAHVGCLAEMAARNEWMVLDGDRTFSRWAFCATCHQPFIGALDAEMARRKWRHYRDDNSDVRRMMLQSVAITLRKDHESDAADGLEEEATEGLARDDPKVLLAEITRADCLLGPNPAAALGILTAVKPRVDRCDFAHVHLSCAMTTAIALIRIDRDQEAEPITAECVQLATEAQGPESTDALEAMELRGVTLINVGRAREGKALLTRVLATRTRVLGADHPSNLRTKRHLDRVSDVRL